MKASTSASANRQSHFIRTPDDKYMRRVASNDRFVHKSLNSAHPADQNTAADTNTRYSISYLPGASEHM